LPHVAKRAPTEGKDFEVRSGFKAWEEVLKRSAPKITATSQKRNGTAGGETPPGFWHLPASMKGTYAAKKNALLKGYWGKQEIEMTWDTAAVFPCRDVKKF